MTVVPADAGIERECRTTRVAIGRKRAQPGLKKGAQTIQYLHGNQGLSHLELAEFEALQRVAERCAGTLLSLRQPPEVAMDDGLAGVVTDHVEQP